MLRYPYYFLRLEREKKKYTFGRSEYFGDICCQLLSHKADKEKGSINANLVDILQITFFLILLN